MKKYYWRYPPGNCTNPLCFNDLSTLAIRPTVTGDFLLILQHNYCLFLPCSDMHCSFLTTTKKFLFLDQTKILKR